MALSNAERQRKYRVKNKNNPEFRSKECIHSKEKRKNPNYAKGQLKNACKRLQNLRLRRKKIAVDIAPFTTKASEQRAFQR